jgi:formylglycine-generating enzyme required for sulfatase activity
MRILLTLAAALIVPLSVQAVTIDTVLIGHPGNSPDLLQQPLTGLFGAVDAAYRIAATEVTNAQYVEFLNAVAAADPYRLYNSNMSFFLKGGITRSGSAGSYAYAVKPDALVMEEGGSSYNYTYGDKPVVYVSWYDAIRFTNWLHNGQGSGNTETGAYTLGPVNATTGVPLDGDSIVRNAGAKWFLPDEDEWYKAAYYDGDTNTYYDYPTGTDTAPDNNLPADDTGNSANFLVGFDTTTGQLDYPYTPAGAYTLSESRYGTFDQAGNVWEWNQTLISAGVRGRRGGAWDSDATTLSAATQGSRIATSELDSIGFRVASIPQPEGLAGDFNGDGMVDAADYVVWRKMNGTPEQYDEWRANFGMTSPGGGSSHPASVPEPAAWGLFAAGAAWLLSFRRWASRRHRP